MQGPFTGVRFGSKVNTTEEEILVNSIIFMLLLLLLLLVLIFKFLCLYIAIE